MGLTFRAAAMTAALGSALLVSSLQPGHVIAQQKQRTPGWSNAAEVSFLVTGGNARATTFGLKGDSRRTWEHTEFRLEGGAVQTQSTHVDRFAVQTSTGEVEIIEARESRVTAESYYLRAKIDRTLGDGAFAFASFGWERNTFAGFRGRYISATGAGLRWVNTDASQLRTDLGVTYTVQRDLIEDPSRANAFGGLRLTSELKQKLTSNTSFHSEIAIDGNASEPTDYRAAANNALTVALSERLALKTALQLTYDHQPALRSLPLQLADGQPLGENVLVPLQSLDSVFTLALVVNF